MSKTKLMSKTKMTAMSAERMLGFIRRWRDLETRRKSHEHDLNVLSRDMRNCFPSGERGDEKYSKWLETELGLDAYRQREMCLRAVAGAIVPDQATMERLGGYSRVRLVQFLARDEQVAVLEAAKVGNKSIISVMRERGHYAELKRGPVPVVANADLVALARYVAAHVRRPPAEIAAIVGRVLGTTRTEDMPQLTRASA